MLRRLKELHDRCLPRQLLTTKEQLLVAFILALIVVGGIVQQLRSSFGRTQAAEALHD